MDFSLGQVVVFVGNLTYVNRLRRAGVPREAASFPR
jgi:hypothetical protein